MFRTIPIVTALAAVLATGAVHGIWTERWARSEEPASWAARLPHVSLGLEDWEGEAVPTKSSPSGGVAGHMHHRYVHRRTGKLVTAFIVCGRPGPVAVHTPDVCYGASGYDVLSRTHYALPEADFNVANFRKKEAADLSYLRIFWAWSAAGPWSAPDDPRFTYAKHPALYKLYLIRDLASPDEPLDDDPCVELMRQLLPELQRVLANPS